MPGRCSCSGFLQVVAEVVELQQPHAVLADVVAERVGVHRLDRLRGAAEERFPHSAFWSIEQSLARRGCRRSTSRRPRNCRSTGPGQCPACPARARIFVSPLGKRTRIEAFQVAVVIDPEIDGVEIELAAGLPLPFGDLGDVVQHEGFGFVEAAVRACRRRARRSAYGLSWPRSDAAHAAAQMGDERLPRLARFGHAVNGLHARETLSRRQFDPRDIAAG